MNKILSEQKKRSQDNEKQFSFCKGTENQEEEGTTIWTAEKKAENYHEFWSLIKPCHDGTDLQIKHMDIFPALDRVYYPEQLMSSHD